METDKSGNQKVIETVVSCRKNMYQNIIQQEDIDLPTKKVHTQKAETRVMSKAT
jgi:hypothetical protein